MSGTPPKSNWLPRLLTIALIALALGQLALGGLVQARPGTLVCDDWPLCYGKLLPVPGEQLFYEMAHRLLAGLLGVGSLVLGLVLHGRAVLSGRHWMPLFWVVVQAALGWVTFKHRLPTLVTLLHLLLVPVYLWSLLDLSHRLRLTPASVPFSRHAKDVPNLFLILFFFQLLLGGLIRKTGGSGLSPMPPAVEKLHLLHRTLGVLGVLGLGAAWGWMLRVVPLRRWYFPLVPLAALFQLLGGFALARWMPGPWATVTHLGGAGVLLCLLLAAREDVRRSEANPVPGWLGDLLLLTKARLGLLVMATVLVGMLIAPFQLTFLASLTVFVGIAFQAMGACALNCVIEKDVDARMERTRVRPLPGGRMSVGTANLIGWGLVGVGTLMILAASNGLTAGIGVFTVLVYLYAYTPLKQRSPWALVVGAVPGATPPLMGWTAVTGEVSGPGWYLFLFLFFWQLPHFLAIAVYHQKDYAEAHIATFFRERGPAFIKRWILVLSFVLGALGFFPYDWQGSNAAYHFVTLLLGGIFFGLALQGWLMKDEGEEFRRWARLYFLGTLFYLPLQLTALLILP